MPSELAWAGRDPPPRQSAVRQGHLAILKGNLASEEAWPRSRWKTPVLTGPARVFEAEDCLAAILDKKIKAGDVVVVATRVGRWTSMREMRLPRQPSWVRPATRLP